PIVPWYGRKLTIDPILFCPLDGIAFSGHKIPKDKPLFREWFTTENIYRSVGLNLKGTKMCILSDKYLLRPIDMSLVRNTAFQNIHATLPIQFIPNIDGCILIGFDFNHIYFAMYGHRRFLTKSFSGYKFIRHAISFPRRYIMCFHMKELWLHKLQFFGQGYPYL